MHEFLKLREEKLAERVKQLEALIVYMKLKEPKGSIVYIYEAPTSVRIIKSCLDGDENE